jgi:hypothetical protein
MFRYRTVFNRRGKPLFLFTDGPVTFVRYIVDQTNAEIDVVSKQFMKDVPKLMKSKKYLCVKTPESLTPYITTSTVAIV